MDYAAKVAKEWAAIFAKQAAQKAAQDKLIQPCIANPNAGPNRHASHYEAETFAGHDNDVGDLFDHLDPETRHLVREAIAMDDYAMDETLHAGL